MSSRWRQSQHAAERTSEGSIYCPRFYTLAARTSLVHEECKNIVIVRESVVVI